MDNSSGQGKRAVVPNEVRGWNWGAFLLNIFWGIGNNTFVALLTLVPLFGLIVPFVLGVKGNEWAWKNKRWESIEQFKSIQNKWRFWGAIVFLCFVGFFAIMMITMPTVFKKSAPYQMAISQLMADAKTQMVFGNPIKIGWWVSGKLEVDGNGNGNASFNLSFEGPKDKGKAYISAIKKMNQWNLTELTVKASQANESWNIIDRTSP